MWPGGSASFGTMLQGPLPSSHLIFCLVLAEDILKNIFGHLPFHLPCLWGAVLHSTLGVSKVRMSSFFWWGAWTSPSKVQTSRGNLHLSESDWGEFLLKFDLGPHVASLVMSTPLFVQVVHVWRGVNLCFHLPSRREGPKLEHNFQPWDQNS